MPRSALIVDDSRLIRAIVRTMLEPLGFDVSDAATGREALLQCEAKSPALIVLDWYMDDMTGPEVAARITELKERVGVDEMAVVTWTHDEDIRRQSYALLAQAYGFAPGS